MWNLWRSFVSEGEMSPTNTSELGSLPGWWVTVSWPLSTIQGVNHLSQFWHNVNSVEVSEHAKTRAGATCWNDRETWRNCLIIGDAVTALICWALADASVITTVSKVHQPVPNNNAGSCESLDLWLPPLCRCGRRGRSSVRTKTPWHTTPAEDVSPASTHVLYRDLIYSVVSFLTSSKLIKSCLRRSIKRLEYSEAEWALQ